MNTASSASPATSNRQRPRTVTVAAICMAVQAVGFSAFGIFEYFQLEEGRVGTGVMTATLLLAWGVVLGLLAWQVREGRAWTRGPIVALQLIHLPTAWSFRGGETTWVMLGLGLTALVAVTMMVLPATTAYLVGRRTATS